MMELNIKPHERELLCQRCGLEYPTWVAPNNVWNATARDGEHYFCPTCFAVLAEERQVVIPVRWSLRPEGNLSSGLCGTG